MGMFDILSSDNTFVPAYMKQINKGSGKANEAFMQGIQPWQNLQGQSQQGLDLYGNLVGLGTGGMGQDQRQSFLENTPGYQYALGEGEKALLRNANSRGMLASGNTSLDLMRHGQGMASQNYFNILNSLFPYFNQATNAASGIQSGYNAIGGNEAQTGQLLAQGPIMQQQLDAQAAAAPWNVLLGVGNAAASGVGAYTGAGGTF